MANYTKKCKACKGAGCYKCEHSGIQLYSETEEKFDDASEITGDKLHPGDTNFIDIEEDDYEI